MKKFSRKRAAIAGGAVVTIGAVAALLVGSTFGLFSSAGVTSGSNTFTAGHVVVGLSGSTSVTCTIAPMSPGDNQASSGSSGQNVACEYDVQYTGNVNAYMALDLKITGSPGSPIEPPYNGGSISTAPTAKQGLYDGTATGLQFNIADASSTTYMTGTSYNNINGAPTNLSPTSGAATVLDLLVNTTPVVHNNTRLVTVDYNLPLSAGNAYNLATSTITLTIHAVQADNNPLPSGCTAVGNQCSTMNWS
jgi:hypothetical protein